MNITAVCSETLFSKNLFHIEIRQLICIANQVTDFYISFYWKVFPNKLYFGQIYY